ncbi:small heat shock protein [Pisolithus sp. B1]|nr:small heat shock protein [Pisolithus sp. B1]
MSLTQFYYDPFAEFDRLFENAFASRFQRQGALNEGGRNVERRQGLLCPKLDLHENKETNTVIATFELPGLRTEDVAIDVHENRLTVSGEFNKSDSREEGGFAVRERHHGKFSRTIQLPNGVKWACLGTYYVDVQPEDIKAKMENGVLTVSFPRLTAEQQPHRITIS